MEAPGQPIPSARRLASTSFAPARRLASTSFAPARRLARTSFATGAGCVVALLVGCAGAKPVLEPSPLPPRPAGALEVELVFDAAADLDLHVTDPELETVYFGNTPSVNGGRLDRDVRCEEAAEGDARRETVRFDAPLPGRYRVGVDHVKACRRFGKAAAYTIRVRGPGLELEAGGEAEPGRFAHRALEFDWPAGEPDRAGDPP